MSNLTILGIISARNYGKRKYKKTVEGGQFIRRVQVSALTNVLANKSRVVVIYNWNGINTNPNALNAIKEINK